MTSIKNLRTYINTTKRRRKSARRRRKGGESYVNRMEESINNDEDILYITDIQTKNISSIPDVDKEKYKAHVQSIVKKILDELAIAQESSFKNKGTYKIDQHLSNLKSTYMKGKLYDLDVMQYYSQLSTEDDTYEYLVAFSNEIKGERQMLQVKTYGRGGTTRVKSIVRRKGGVGIITANSYLRT